MSCSNTVLPFIQQVWSPYYPQSVGWSQYTSSEMFTTQAIRPVQNVMGTPHPGSRPTPSLVTSQTMPSWNQLPPSSDYSQFDKYLCKSEVCLNSTSLMFVFHS